MVIGGTYDGDVEDGWVLSVSHCVDGFSECFGGSRHGRVVCCVLLLWGNVVGLYATNSYFMVVISDAVEDFL